ncbi:MAG: helix-turn-helix domain-containing protein [Acetobacter sp.]|nr:helix-turn-helix domain-containing protein [Bacteroides sp.]MCM1340125.1 helix-turn-helix domain-containing protein [Acetobacter sp.]MCM1432707.1 helix-turn-helix domain-containing protein [Clostridiales bacterium]
MSLGSNIVKIRKDNNMSQEEFAQIFNVTRQTISNWENSKSYPDIETLIKISDRYNISLDILLKEDMELVKDIDTKVKETDKYKKILKIMTYVLAILISIFCLATIIFISGLTIIWKIVLSAVALVWIITLLSKILNRLN